MTGLTPPYEGASSPKQTGLTALRLAHTTGLTASLRNLPKEGHLKTRPQTGRFTTSKTHSTAAYPYLYSAVVNICRPSALTNFNISQALEIGKGFKRKCMPQIVSLGPAGAQNALRRAAQSFDLGTSKRARQGVDD